MAFERKDHFYRKAKREGKASRAVYKLAELQKRFRLVNRGDSVIDLGCAPGGWLQEVAPLLGPKGMVVGIDLLPLKISLPKNSAFVHGDLNDEASQDEVAKLAGGRADCILSDMSPNLSGVQFADAFRSYELAMRAFEMCERFLCEGGNFVVKIFPGEEFPGYVAMLRKRFAKVNALTPEATRKTSSERYIVCQGFKREQR